MPDLMFFTNSDINALKTATEEVKYLLYEANSDALKTPKPFATFQPVSEYYTGLYDPQTIAMSTDCQIIYKLGLAYKLTGHTYYAQKAQEFLYAWANTLTSINNDQAKGSVAFFLPMMVIGADFVKDYNNFDADDSFTNFLNNVIKPHSLSLIRNNNIAAWWCCLDACIAVWNNNSPEILTARDTWKHIINTQVDAEGFLPQEIDRTATTNYHDGPDKGIRGIHYSHHFMRAMTIAGQILKNRAVAIHTTTEGLKFKQAFEKVAGYVMNRLTFPYYLQLTANGYGCLNVDDTSYFRNLVRYYTVQDASSCLYEQNQKYDQFFITFVLSKRWIPK